MDLSPLRSEFPALSETDATGRPYVYLDGAGGTQVPLAVIEAMANYLARTNANLGGQYHTSKRTGEIVAAARGSAADFFNAPAPDEIIFGLNMTTLTFHLSRAIARELRPGDEVIVTRLDHDANISPWLSLEQQGVVVRWADMHPEDCTLDLQKLQDLITERTRLVAVGYASNAVGTVNDVAKIAEWAHAVGAWIYVDAVQYAPHGPIDVQALDCDFLICSAYKYFGPHLGVLWGRRDLLERLRPDKVRPQAPRIPGCYETGTKNYEGLAGLVATLEYLRSVGERFGTQYSDQFPNFSGRRLQLKAAMAAIHDYEQDLSARLIDGLSDVPGLRIYGITNRADAARRIPTVSFTLDGLTPQAVAKRLADEGIFVWDGNFYALAVTERLGLEASGGLVRASAEHYNTMQEMDRLVDALQRIAHAK